MAVTSDSRSGKARIDNGAHAAPWVDGKAPRAQYSSNCLISLQVEYFDRSRQYPGGPTLSSHTTREALLAALLEAGRESTTASILFHGAVADRVGLCPADHKALDVLLRHGPLTAGEISGHTGLASASVTSLIDRLEAKGFVHRASDPGDRRRVIVEPVPERAGELTPLFASLKQELMRLLERYDDEQLATIRDFLESSAAVLREETARLAAKHAD